MSTLLASFRLPFLLLTISCVFLGYCTASASGGPISTAHALLVLLGALAAHISVNTFNEYQDFHSGLDARTTRTPFSGGSGALVQNPSGAPVVLGAALASLAIVVLVGCYFLWIGGLALLPLGLCGIVIIVTYTQWLNRYPLPCLLAPGTGFGMLMVAGTHYVLAGQFSGQLWLAALVVFFLVNNLLLLNQFPDREPDASIGRRHFPIAYGLEASAAGYALLSCAALAILLAGIYLAVFPRLASLALLPLLAGLVALPGVFRFARQGGEPVASLLPSMALNVVAAVGTPAVLGLAILIG